MNKVREPGAYLERIALYGPDGSGKTTLASLLHHHIERVHGLGKVKTFWIRGMHTLALLIALFYSKFRSMRGNDVPQLGIRLANRCVWAILEYVSVIPIILKYLIMSKLFWRDKVIVSERSLVDTAVWVSMHYKSCPLHKLFIGFLLRLSLSVYDAFVYVRADPRVIIKRRQGIENLSFDYITRQVVLYNLLHRVLCESKACAGKRRSCLIDTSNKSPAESFTELRECLKLW